MTYYRYIYHSLRSLSSSLKIKDLGFNLIHIHKIKEIIDHQKSILDDIERLSRLKDDRSLVKELTWEHKIIDDELHDAILQYPIHLFLNGDCIVLINAMVGGRESSLFVHEFYHRFWYICDKLNFNIRIIDQNIKDNELKKIVFHIKGLYALRYFLLETGTHRIQRKPITSKQGKVHTSTLIINVKPLIKSSLMKNFILKKDELKIFTKWSTGKGGQHVNTTDSAVSIRHIPTNITVTIQNERSQFDNKWSALSILHSRVFYHHQSKIDQALKTLGKKQINFGQRSDKVWTYNDKQNRISDHRFKWNYHTNKNVINSIFDVEFLKYTTWDYTDSMIDIINTFF